jgi:hypothetical protein
MVWVPTPTLCTKSMSPMWACSLVPIYGVKTQPRVLLRISVYNQRHLPLFWITKAPLSISLRWAPRGYRFILLPIFHTTMLFEKLIRSPRRLSITKITPKDRQELKSRKHLVFGRVLGTSFRQFVLYSAMEFCFYCANDFLFFLNK